LKVFRKKFRDCYQNKVEWNIKDKTINKVYMLGYERRLYDAATGYVSFFSSKCPDDGTHCLIYIAALC
jgi:hypothetical protein